MKSQFFSFQHLCCLLIGLLLVSIQARSTTTTVPGRKIQVASKLSLVDQSKWDLPKSPFLERCSLSLLSVRGGSDEEEEDEEESTGIDASSVLNKVADFSKKTLIVLGKATISTAKAFQRAIKAGLQGDEEAAEDVEESDGVATKIVKTLKRMIKAAFAFPTDDEEEEDSKRVSESDDDDEEDDDAETEGSESSEEPSSTSKARADFGTFLSKSYGVADQRDESGPPILGGTLGDALQMARSEARLLVVFTPMARPASNNKGTKDQLAIHSILSSEVADAANKRARKSGEDTGSFFFWGAKAGSSEATSATKRLKAKATSSKGEKRPILTVVYPAQTIDSSGAPKIVPKLIAQHHCSPPPNPALMAAWLNALRKRHAKQYSAMQTELKEVQYCKERKEGYIDSVQSDIERKEREKEEEAKRLAEEQAEKELQEAIEIRRTELKSSLPEEVTSGKSKKIAIRFADGRSGQRRFSPDQPLSDVFNWVDAMYEIEREKVILTTMNGQKTFTWDDETNDNTLDEAGLGRSAGFRVAEKKEEPSDKSEEGSSQ